MCRTARQFRMSQVTDRQLYDRIVAGAPVATSAASGHVAFVADRAEMALRTCRAMGCRSRAEVLSYLGRHFRVALHNVLDSDTDVEVRGPRAATPCLGVLMFFPAAVCFVVGKAVRWRVLLDSLSRLLQPRQQRPPFQRLHTDSCCVCHQKTAVLAKRNVSSEAFAFAAAACFGCRRGAFPHANVGKDLLLQRLILPSKRSQCAFTYRSAACCSTVASSST